MGFIDDRVREVIAKVPSECAYIDYKRIPYLKTNYHDMVKDVIAMLNSLEAKGHDKFIIFGITDEGERIGIESFLEDSPEKYDDASYQNSFQKIIPRPHIQCGLTEYEQHKYGYIYIQDSLNNSKIYEINEHVVSNEKDYKKVAYKGTAYTRNGSKNRIMMQTDRDELINYQTYLIQPIKDYSRVPFESYKMDALVVAAIIGAWDETNESDISIIEKFYKHHYADWIEIIRKEKADNNEMFSFDGKKWSVNDQRGLLFSISNSIYKSQLEMVKEAFLECINNYNKKYDLSSDIRYAHAICNIDKYYSNEIISGIISFFAIVSNNNNNFKNIKYSDIETVSYNVVSEVLYSNDWKSIASIKDYLFVFVEICPDAFLSCAEKQLAKKTSSLYHFVIEEEQSITINKYGSSLAYALVVIARIKEYFSRASYCIFLLSEINNEYLHVLTDIILPWHPQTDATSEQRIALVDQLISTNNNLSWELVYSLLPNITTTCAENQIPQFIKYEKTEKNETVPDSYGNESYRYIDRAIDLAKGDAKRTEKLFYLINIIEKEYSEKIIGLVTSFNSDTPDKEKYLLWDSLKTILEKYEEETSTADSIIGVISKSIAKAINYIEPISIVYKSKRAFKSELEWKYLSNKESREKYDEEISLLRIEQLQKIYDDGGFDLVSEAIEEFESIAGVANALSKSTFAHEIDYGVGNWIESESNSKKRIAKAYIGFRLNGKGYDWLETIIVNLKEETIATILSCVPVNRKTIELAEKNISKDTIHCFWEQVEEWQFTDYSQIDLIVEMLLKYNQAIKAIRFLFYGLHNNCELSNELIYKSLMELPTESKNLRGLDEYHIIDLVEYLEANYNDDQKVIDVEIRCFRLLRGKSKQPKRLYKHISSYPEQFIEVLKLAFKGEHQTDEEFADEKVKSVAKHCFEIIYHWKLVPGLSNDVLDEDFLCSWFEKTKKLSIECDRYEVAMNRIGAMLYYSPKDPSGLFINKTVAKILHNEGTDEIRRGFSSEVVNSRGAHIVDPSGKPEFELEKQYKQYADSIDELGYFRFAKTLRDIARGFHYEALNNIEHEKKWSHND